MTDWMVTHCRIAYPDGKVEVRYSVIDSLSYPMFLAQTSSMPHMFSDARVIKKGLSMREAMALRDTLKGDLK